jgi:hypothetical protein
MLLISEDGWMNILGAGGGVPRIIRLFDDRPVVALLPLPSTSSLQPLSISEFLQCLSSAIILLATITVLPPSIESGIRTWREYKSPGQVSSAIMIPCFALHRSSSTLRVRGI